MGHATGFGHAFLEAFVTSKVVAHQLVIPRIEEVTRMLTGTVWAEVIDHGFQCRERRGE